MTFLVTTFTVSPYCYLGISLLLPGMVLFGATSLHKADNGSEGAMNRWARVLSVLLGFAGYASLFAGIVLSFS